jgi:hypothetical protein
MMMRGVPIVVLVVSCVSAANAQAIPDTMLIRALRDASEAASHQRRGSYAIPALAGGIGLGFFGLIAFNGHPLPLAGAGASVAALLLTSAAAHRDSKILPDSVTRSIALEDARYRDAFAREYGARINKQRQTDVVVFGVLGTAVGFAMLINLLSGT